MVKRRMTAPQTCTWDAEAVQILMDIIHGRTRSVLKAPSLEMLAKIAVLVGYYECRGLSGTPTFLAKSDKIS
jgi:hypothetical protein